MDERKHHKTILIVSVVFVFVSFVFLLIGLRLKIEYAIALPATFILFSFFSIITSFAVKYQNKLLLTSIAKYSIYCTPFFAISVVYIGYNYDISAFNDTISILFWAILFLSSVLTILTLLHFFVYSDITSTLTIIVFIVFLILGIIMKRYRLPYSNIIITIFSFLISIGSIMYGIRCLFIAGKMYYFRNIVFFGSLFMSVAYLGQQFRFLHWPLAGVLVIIGFGGLILGTIYLLITLHSSGYIDWQPLHKKVLRKILIPWTFIFIMYISRYMVPELNSLIWTPNVTRKTLSNYGFSMKDYSIDEKADKIEK